MRSAIHEWLVSSDRTANYNTDVSRFPADWYQVNRCTEVFRELKQRRRQRQGKRYLKIYLYFTCATSRLFQLAQLLKKMANYPETKLVGVAYKLRKKIKNSPSCVHVLHKTLNVVISRCCFEEDDKKMYQNVKRMCGAIVFPIVLRRCRCRRRRRCLSSLLSKVDKTGMKSISSFFGGGAKKSKKKRQGATSDKTDT